ncbi:hypothetical protein GGR58DRAFT_451931 [Xylaria digitata]|nr:hypothetical protein GGR58DRAFT_451931 [Xylaria digitata]
MKIIFTFHECILSFVNKANELIRSLSRPNPDSTNAPPRSTWLDKAPQVIPASSVDMGKMIELLNNKFGSRYRLELSRDEFRLYADEILSDHEIGSTFMKRWHLDIVYS